MKKKKFIIFLIFIVIFISPISAFARAGGGGGGSGGSGSGGSASSSSSGSHYNNSRSSKRSNPLANIIGTVIIFTLIVRKNISKRFSIVLNNRKARILLKILENKGYKWNYKEIDRRIEVVFFKIQEAWTNNDINIAKEYVSDKVYDLYNSKLQWMKVNNKRNILDKIKLLEAKPVGVVSFADKKDDFMWFYIKASLIDYTINEISGQLIEGKTYRTRFDEYWKFKWNEHEWVLDEILQTGEIDGKGYFYSSVEEKDKFIK